MPQDRVIPTAIRAYTEPVESPDFLLLDLEENSPLREPLLTIKKSGEKAAEIVQDLLTLARRGVESRRVINLNQVLREFLASPECGKFLDYHFDPEILVKFKNRSSPDQLHSEHV